MVGGAEPAAAQRRSTATPSTATSSSPSCGRAGWSATSLAPTCSCSPPCCTTSARWPGPSDHSVTGAQLADTRSLRRIGVADADREIVVRLVRQHLTLVDLATRRDPEDPATIAALSEAVDGSVATLDLLRALTEADASAAGPKAWSDWRAGLVDEALRHLPVGAHRPDRRRGPPVVEPDRDPSPQPRCARAHRLGRALRHRHAARWRPPGRHHRPRPRRPLRRHGRPARRARLHRALGHRAHPRGPRRQRVVGRLARWRDAR